VTSQQSVVTLRSLYCGATRRTACMQLSNDLSRYSNKIQSVGNFVYCESDFTIISELAPQHDRKTGGIDRPTV